MNIRRKNNKVRIETIKRVIAVLLILAFLSCPSCYRTVHRVTYSNVCGSWENFIYTSKETFLAHQHFDPTADYLTDDATRVRTIVGINIQNDLEEEIYLFDEAPQGDWGSLDVSNERERIAVVLRDTLCIISTEREKIIAKIEGGKNPCFLPDGDKLLYEKDGQIFIYSVFSGSGSLFIEEGCNPRIDEKERKMVYIRDTQIILLNLSNFEEFLLVDTANVSNPDISPDGSKIIYLVHGTRTFFLIDTLGTELETYEAKGAFPPNRRVINYPYFVGNDKFVYRSYSYITPFKILYLQELSRNTPVLIRREYETYD